MIPTVHVQTSQWLRRIGGGHPSALTLICLPHAGGGASMFRQWPASLPPAIGVFAVQYPGHEGRWGMPACRDVLEIVEPLSRAIETQISGDYALFGHSLGGLLAFEVARAIRRRTHREPVHLLVSASRAPDAPDRKPYQHVMPDAELLAYVRRLGGVPDGVFEYGDIVSAVLSNVRSGIRMYELCAYVPDTPLSCPITVLAGEQDDEVDSDQLTAWDRQTSASSCVERFPGGHFFVSTAEDLVLSRIRAALDPHLG